MNANDYYEWSKHYDPEYLEFEYLKNMGIDFSGKKVLEVGCGTGRFTGRLSTCASEIIGIDPDEESVKLCIKNLRSHNVNISIGTLESMNFPENYFDYVVFSWSMYMIDDKEKNIKIAYDTLKAGGHLVILQAKAGEFEEEVSKLYEKYSSLCAYENTCNVLDNIILKVFDNIKTGELVTYFIFDNIEQVVNKSIFFIIDEEGMPPSEQNITQFKKVLENYSTDEGKIKMTDIVSVYIAKK